MASLVPEPTRTGSGNLANALDLAVSGCDDFLTGGDLTLSHIHNLSSECITSKLGIYPFRGRLFSGPAAYPLSDSLSAASPKALAPEPSPRQASNAPNPEPATNGGVGTFMSNNMVPPLASPPSPSAASTSSRSSTRDATPLASPLPKVAIKSPRPSGGPPTQAARMYPSPEAKKPRSSSGSLPRVALLAQQQAAKKAEGAATASTRGTSSARGSGSGRALPPPPSRNTSSRQSKESSSVSKPRMPVSSRSNSATSSTRNSNGSTTKGEVGIRPAWGAANSGAPKPPRRSTIASKPTSSGSIPAPPLGRADSPSKSRIPRPKSSQGSAVAVAEPESDVSPRAQLADLMGLADEIAEVKKELGLSEVDESVVGHPETKDSQGAEDAPPGIRAADAAVGSEECDATLEESARVVEEVEEKEGDKGESDALGEQEEKPVAVDVVELETEKEHVPALPMPSAVESPVVETQKSKQMCSCCCVM